MSEQSIAAQAWDATKEAGDPEFGAIPNLEFKEKLHFAADRVMNTGIATTNFEKEVASIVAQKKGDDAPMAVVESGVDFAKAAKGKVEGGSQENTAKSETRADALDAEKFAKSHNRKQLDKLAKKAGLNAKDFKTNKDIATAILQAQAGESTDGEPQGDQSGHVATGDEAASIIKEEANAPLHP